MKGVLAGKNVDGRQTHEAELAAVGSAADSTPLGGESGAAHGGFGMEGDLGVAFQHLVHVAVLRVHLECELEPRLFGADFGCEGTEALGIVRQVGRAKAAQYEVNLGGLYAAVHLVGVHETLRAFGALRAPVLG